MTREKFCISFLFLFLLFTVSGCGAPATVVEETPSSETPTDLPLSPTPLPPTPTQASRALIQLTKCNAQCFAPAWLAGGDEISYFSSADQQIHIANLKGENVRAFALPGGVIALSWSPDGNQMAFVNVNEQQNDLTVHAALGDNARVIFSTPASISQVSWSSDGQFIYFVMGRNPASQLGPKAPLLLKINVATSESEKIATLPAGAMDVAISPDGTQVAYVATSSAGRAESLNLLKVGESRPSILVKQELASPSWSSDGAQIAFVSGSPDSEIYIVHADGTGLVQWTDHSGYAEREPLWSPDGSCVIFTANSLAADGSLAADDQVYMLCN